ncbi:MAG: phytanoyl-CoA dioxygenase family protein [Candidatus Latescibacteria bacterium]|nr:phytanoyl-CoA dioxygenase family protein [Candidatus Latescibacterota bacterium]
MLTDAQVQEFDEKGFLGVGRVLDDEAVERLRADLDLVMAGKSPKPPVLNRNMLAGKSEYEGGKGGEAVIQIVNIWQASEVFYQHACHPTITAMASQLCRTDTLRIWHDQIQYKPPEQGGPTGWHQDQPLWPILQPPDLISAWVALDDATVENGCMWMVPGSHTWGNQQKWLRGGPDFINPEHKDVTLLPADARLKAEPIEVMKGACAFHHCLTWHGSPHNRSKRPRRAIAVHYMPGHIRYEPTGRHVMDQFVNVPKGDVLSGDTFPVVYQKK